MKKTYLSPLCSIFHIEGTAHLLTVSSPATKMEAPNDYIYDDTDPMNPKHSKYDDEESEEDDWGY